MKKTALCLCIACAVLSGTAWAGSTNCPSDGAAQAAATEQAVVQDDALRPEVSNPTVEAVRGSQCTNHVSTFQTILNDLNSLPIGSKGQQILQFIEQLFGQSQNDCNPYVTSSGAMPTATNPSGGGSLPSMTLVQQNPLTPTKDSNGKNSGSGLYQSLFP